MSRALAIAVASLFAFTSVPGALAATTLRPRMGSALGVVPAAGAQLPATGQLTSVEYHGGPVMSGGVTVHTIFWTGGTNQFQGHPAGAPHDYVGMIQRYYVDIAHDSTGTSGGTCTPSACNVFTVLPQYASGTSPGNVTPGSYSISYDPASDSLIDTNPYPAKPDQCASGNDAAVCITDSQVKAEIDRLAQLTPGTPRGLHNLWYVFLPPGVDECLAAGACASNGIGGYHGWFDRGHGETIFAVGPDPLLFQTLPVGIYPQGFADAELAIEVAGHEVVEAITDPEGTGWYDPNWSEIGDKCEFNPQYGTPLGLAPDGAAYNQVINGHHYLIQEMWANAADDGNPACVRATTNTSNPLPLPQVELTQFSSTVRGNTETGSAGVGVTVSLIRADASGNPATVAQGATTTAGDGTWSVSLAPHAVGDDRDEIDIDYSGAGAPVPNHQVILTGNGFNLFAGWAGWSLMSNSSALTNQAAHGGSSLSVGWCFPAGSIFSSVTSRPLSDFCDATTSVASEPLSLPVGPGKAVTWSSTDNRAWQPPQASTPNIGGGLVTLTVPVGEADSVSPASGPGQFFAEFGIPFTPGGLPSCTADLAAQSVSCTGLVPGQGYTLADGDKTIAVTADAAGAVTGAVALKGGDSVTLSNAFRTLTTLHVAHLRVSIDDRSPGVLAGGTCEPYQYYGAPVSNVPISGQPGMPSALAGGAALTGQVCPSSGDASGLPSDQIAQTDDHSGGLTQTEVADVLDTSPLAGETLHGEFIALAELSVAAAHVAVSIAPAAGGAPVFSASNVDQVNGVQVPAPAPGEYVATWTVSDANGDTRVLSTRFSEAPDLRGAQGPAGPQGPLATQGPPGGAASPGGPGAAGGQGPQGPTGPAGAAAPAPRVTCKLTGRRQRKITCKIVLPATSGDSSVVISITRGLSVAALGHGRLRYGSARITMGELRTLTSGAWRVTLVLSSAHGRPRTLTLALRVARR